MSVAGVPGRLVYEAYILVLVLGGQLVLSDLTERHRPGTVVAVLAGSAVAVLLRLRFPALALAAGGLLLTAADGGQALLVCLGYGAGYRVAGWRRAVPAFAVAVLAPPVADLLSSSGDPRMLAELARHPLTSGIALAGAALTGSYVVLAGVLGRYSAQRIVLLDALRQRNQQLYRNQSLAAEQARLRERTRIARDLHDSLGNHLSLISVGANAFAVDPGLGDPQRERARALSSAAHAALEDLRDAVGVLRQGDDPSGADDPAPGGTRVLDRIEELVQRAREGGTDVRLVRAGAPASLSAFGEQAAYRTVQEGLTNARKHAPGAPVEVGLRYEPDALIVDVVSGGGTGPSEPSPGGGQGLIGLAERARLAGGMLRAGPTREGGHRLCLLLPFAATRPESGPEPAPPPEPPEPSGPPEPPGPPPAGRPRRTEPGTPAGVAQAIGVSVPLVGAAAAALLLLLLLLGLARL
jgi:signal transduction histidine kinase